MLSVTPAEAMDYLDACEVRRRGTARALLLRAGTSRDPASIVATIDAQVPKAADAPAAATLVLHSTERSTEAFVRYAEWAASFVEATSLPGPSRVLRWQQNPRGKGFYFDAEQGAGQPLPQLEDPQRPIRSPVDRVRPHCWAPMPLDSSLRLDHATEEGGSLHSKFEERNLLPRVSAHAPPSLQFERLDVGTEIVLEGMGSGSPLTFRIPEPPFEWVASTSGRSVAYRPVLWWIQLDASARLASLLYWTKVLCPLIQREERIFAQRPSGAIGEVLPPGDRS